VDKPRPPKAPPSPCGVPSTIAQGIRCALPTGHPGRHRGNLGTVVIKWGGDRWRSDSLQ
jgi:hypothetical protein